MNPKEYEEFILRLYNAGKDNIDAISEMHSFVAQPDALQTILESISSHQLSRITVLISLSCIPNVHISGPGDMDYLRTWFCNLCFNDIEYISSDDFAALLSDIFLFIYQGNQTSGSDLIQDLSSAGQPQLNLAIQIILRTIEKSEIVQHSEFLIPIAISPFADKNSPPQLINSAALLLNQLLSPEKVGVFRNEFQIIVIRQGIEANFPQSIFSNLFKFQDEPEHVSIHLLELVDAILKFNPASFGRQEVRQIFIVSTVCLFFDYIKKVGISDMKISIISSIFVSLKKSASVLIREDTLDSNQRFKPPNDRKKKKKTEKSPILLYDNLIIAASNVTQTILNNNGYLRHLEMILDFWNNREMFPTQTNQKTEQGEIEAILGIIMRKFFTIESLSVEGQMEEILTDRSSLFVQKIVELTKFNIVSVCQRVCQFLSDELDLSHFTIAAFAIEFLGYACMKEESRNVFENILNCVFDVQLKIKPQMSIVLELALIQFFRSFLKRFIIQYSNQLREFFIRFLIDIQSTSSSIEIIQEIVDILGSGIISDDRLAIIAKDGRVFELITKSQIFSSPEENQPKKVTTALFQTLFQICFSMPNPDSIMKVIVYITNRIEKNENEKIAYLMMGGCFRASNIKYESLYETLNNAFFPLLVKRLELLVSSNEPIEKLDGRIVINILHLFNSISNCFLKISTDYMSNFIVNFSDLTMNVLNLSLDFSEKLNPNSVDYFKIISKISLILSNLLMNDFLNYGILEFYKIQSFQNTTNRIFGLFLIISFDSLLENPILMKRYLVFIHSVIQNYLSLFVNIDDILLQHHVQILVFIMNLENQEFSNKAIEILTLFASLLLPYETQKVEEKCQNAIICIIESALKIVFNCSTISNSMNALIYSYLLNFRKLRNYLFDQFLAKTDSAACKDDLQLIINGIKMSMDENDDDKALRKMKFYLNDLVEFSRAHNVALSI